jgi:eukaryotic-like serine/threonine-protein kinase
LLGKGGMGEVYRARDSKLKRDVAIKVLPDEFSRDSERLARFQQEAEALAALNHQNIAGIYDLQQSDESRFLVLELVEGDTLADLIQKRGALPIDDALHIAKQICEALEAAHEKGIVHRDLKPANVKITPDGKVKVLDFGLAKALAPAGTISAPSESPTMTSSAMTQAGVILGTAAYMSPEQARGKQADKRSDVWAFGSVLFEMLTAKRACDGDEVPDILAAVLRGEPDWAALPSNLPISIRTLVQRCLEKDRKRRIADISTALFLLNEHASLESSPAAAAPPSSGALRGRLFAAAVALVIGAVAAAGATWWITRSASTNPTATRFAIVLPPNQVLGLTGVDRSVAVSPDGTHVAYVTGSQLFVRAINQLDAVPLAGILNPRWPFFSPDSQWIGFFSGVELRKVSVSGPITVCPVTGAARGASWGADGKIVFATSDSTTGLLSVPSGGGEPAVLTKPDHAHGEFDHVSPSVLPGGQAVLFTITPAGAVPENAQVAVLDLKTGERRILIRGGQGAEYVETGHLVYAAGATLRAVPFDLRNVEVTGDPVPVLDQAATNQYGASFTISTRGTLAYIPGGLTSGQFNTPRSVVWVDRQGREEPVGWPIRSYTYPRISPDRTRVALDIRDQDNDIWIGDLQRQTLTRLTFDPGTDYYPLWTPDGRRIIFYSIRGGTGGNLFRQPADGTGSVEQLTRSLTVPHYPYAISPDGKSLVFQENVANTGIDLSVLHLDDPKLASNPLIHSAFVETNAEISPDGHWLAYQSNESGAEEVYVRPFPNVDAGRWQVSTGGGTRPLWARSGRELFYLDANNLLTAVSVQTTPAFSASNPARLFNTRYFSGFGGGGQTVAGRTYDISPDGKRFLMIKDNIPAGQAAPASIVVVLNWFEELKGKVGK